MAMVLVFMLGVISGAAVLGILDQHIQIKQCENCQWFQRNVIDVRSFGGVRSAEEEIKDDSALLQAATIQASTAGRVSRQSCTVDMAKGQDRTVYTQVDRNVIKQSCIVDMDGLILTESGGNPNAIGDKGKSKGLCQIGKPAWEDVNERSSRTGNGPCCTYEKWWKDPETNRDYAFRYVNVIIPQKYFKVWGITDSADARIAAYKYGPNAFKEIWRDWGEEWKSHVSANVLRDLKKYHQFVDEKAKRAKEAEEIRVVTDSLRDPMM